MLWGTSYEHDPPAKFLSAPFNNDWSSSILVSLDPVAVSSVALDILQVEFQVEDLTTTPPRYTYVRFNAVDDYLHQAASSDWWPEGITYDPEGDGTPIASLGVHEHWNNPVDRKYSRNLGIGDGIELVYHYTQQEPSAIDEISRAGIEIRSYLSAGNSILNVVCNLDLHEQLEVRIYNVSGQIMQQTQFESVWANTPNQIRLNQFEPGYYVVTMITGNMSLSQPFMIR